MGEILNRMKYILRRVLKARPKKDPSLGQQNEKLRRENHKPRCQTEFWKSEHEKLKENIGDFEEEFILLRGKGQLSVLGGQS